LCAASGFCILPDMTETDSHTPQPASHPSSHPGDYPRAALVTGGARRIGREIALALAREGWAVAVHYHRSREAAEQLVREIEDRGGHAVALAADLAEEVASSRLLPRAVEALGPLGCLEPNLRAPLVLTQAFAKALPAERGGLVVNLLDQRVWNLTPYFVSYTVSKSALWTLTRTLALALAPRIRVNAIGPGPALPSPRQSGEQFARQSAAMPLGRGASPEEIADAVLFLLAAKSLTGQMIALDGGQHLGWAQPQTLLSPDE
jgi:NAD(P)-dependent dehydrogenase (short-subunit alcohol dehydrogenase family)